MDSDFLASVLADRLRRSIVEGRPFLLGPDGRPDVIINDYFAVGPGRRLRGASPRTIAYRISSFLNVLHAWDVSWREATTEDIAEVRDWRLYDERNTGRVSDVTWHKQVSALEGLYKYAARFGVLTPLVDERSTDNVGGAYVRAADVKWFNPNAFTLWRDVALGGLLPDGSADPSFRGFNVQRDMAFVNMLYRTGLRTQEGGSVLLGVEWPLQRKAGRRYHTLRLASACGKGGKGRNYWVPSAVVGDIGAYVMGERASAVARAQDRYRAADDLLMVVGMNADSLDVVDVDGVVSTRSVDELTPRERLRLFREVDGSLEPLMLWLNRDGMPRPFPRWNSTLQRGNKRIRLLGVRLATMKPHYLRHSFALRWFVVGRLLWQRRVAHLTEEQTHDLREELGSHWGLVQTMLGHASPTTTMSTYLEPFQSLDIEVLLEHAADESVTDLMSAVLAEHPRVESGARP